MLSLGFKEKSIEMVVSLDVKKGESVRTYRENGKDAWFGSRDTKGSMSTQGSFRLSSLFS